ncbi:MAG: class I SAM-dependent methyltransferase [Limisphaerales bacterium]
MSVTASEPATTPAVVYLSAPSPVHMADEWFKIASGEHFWIKRRFDVLRKIGRNLDFSGRKVAEVGCGYGLLQKQMEQRYGVSVDGFDLNADALDHSLAKNHPRFCYNIFDRNPEFDGRYDFLFLFDVIEHIEQEKEFLEAALFHLKAGGYLLVNVPALMIFYSSYDQVVGHQRRYTLKTLERLCGGAGLEKIGTTYWGLPLLPVLFLRNLRTLGQTNSQRIIQNGYQPPGRLSNRLLGLLSALEPIPQRWLGTSVMTIYRKPAGPSKQK